MRNGRHKRTEREYVFVILRNVLLMVLLYEYAREQIGRR